ncbi:PQQ-binding-like beta-propeller repeat protein [Streptomyces sp. SBT349]|uniref:outer membrane protein assembly factor BamB family protein n=1 Tax=Streptomyces sp. SBT349 TaxID=1580539 RepID=UPI00066D8C5A|nr:PQQ-binding-like beta-propeller repeat protein [Streptomyces sp. SBT349]
MAEGDGSRVGLVALPVAVLLLALVTVYVVVFSREDGTADAEDPVSATTTPSPAPAELAEAWRAPAVRAGTGAHDRQATRLWAHDGTVTLVSTAGVTGYGTVDGAVRWQADPPMGAIRPCAAAERTNSAGVGAVLYRAEGAASADADCSVLGLIDTASGALLWSERFERPVSAADATVTVGEEAVTVSLDAIGSVTGFHRFALEDGEELPFPAPPDETLVRPCEGERLPLTARHVGSRVAVLTGCDGRRELSVYHADTGVLEWTHAANDPEFGFTGILAGDPVLLEQGQDLVAYAETGEEAWRLPLSEVRAETSAVAGEVLFARTGETSFAGYDLATGERRWETELPGDTLLFGVGDDGQPLLGHSGEGEGLRMVRLNPADGEETPAGLLPLDPARTADRQRVTLDEHQLYTLTSVPTDEGVTLHLQAFER